MDTGFRPRDTLMWITVPLITESPACGCCAVTVPSCCSEKTWRIFHCRPAPASADTAEVGSWPTTFGTGPFGFPVETVSVTDEPLPIFVPLPGSCFETAPG